MAFPGSTLADEQLISFHREIAPILRQSCVGCHRSGKAKGGLDLTSFATLLRGGKHGPVLTPGDPHESELIDQISGEEPDMPKDNDALIPDEIAIITKWIAQGAKDDTPSHSNAHNLPAPPVYGSLPAISTLAWAPNGDILAVGGFHEVILHRGDGTEIVGRLVGQSPRIEALAFSPDGSLLAVAGGAPSEYGEIQLWNVTERRLVRSIKTTTDSVFGVSFSPDAARVAVGCADKTVRAFEVADGREIMKCDNHIDWVFGTAFTHDGARLVSASRDRALKLIDLATGRLIDDVNKPREPILTLARHPREDLVVCGDQNGALRLHKMIPRAGRLKEGDDKEESFVRELDRLKGPVSAVTFSADGNWIAAAGEKGDARIYKAGDGKRSVDLKTDGTPIFAAAFHPEGKTVALGGYDGKLRFFDTSSGAEIKAIDAMPRGGSPQAALNAR